MPISGPIVHQQLMNAYAETQSRLEAERANTSQVQITREKLNNDRSDALVSLAEHYLPELTRDAIEATWGAVQPTISEVLLRKEDHRRRLQEDLDQLSQRRQQQDQQLLEINRLLDEATQTQQQTSKTVEKRLQEDDQFARLADRAAIAEAALERAEANLQEIDQDSARKLPAYDNSALFRYLHDRGFGTSRYNNRGFTRRMDRALANFIGYQQAKQGYEFLKKTPDQMRKIIAEDRSALDTVMDELERRRDNIAIEHGLPSIIQRVDTLNAERQGLLNSLDQLRVETEAAERELGDLEGTRGPYYREAIRLFREMLDRHDSRELKQRAQQTSDITDDQIVARLMGVEMEMDELDESAQRRREQLDQMQEMLADLGRLVQRFRAAQFDSSRSQFVGSLDIREELDRATDHGDIDQLWQRIRRAQRWGSTTADPITSAAAHPMTQVLVNAMEQAAGGALQTHARRAGDRRAQRDSRRGGDSSHPGHSR